MGPVQFDVRRYRSRSAARPGGGTAHRHRPRVLGFDRQGRYHPRLRAAAAAYGPHRFPLGRTRSRLSPVREPTRSSWWAAGGWIRGLALVAAASPLDAAVGGRVAGRGRRASKRSDRREPLTCENA